MSEFTLQLSAACLRENIQLSAEQLEKLARHWQLVKEANQRFNLTAILSDEEAQNKHYLDSLFLLRELDALTGGLRLADLGSGAGFPGLVVAIARPSCSLTLIEATEKKAAFLADCAEELGLANVSVQALRTEEAGREQKLREGFDAVTARALAPLPVLLEYSLPLLRVGGVMLAMKGPDWENEAALSAKALSELNAELLNTVAYQLPEGSRRALVRVKKLAPTAEKYPRRPGVPSKKPL